MDLRQYDGKHVRVTIFDGSVYEGIVQHNSAEYNEHEFGRDEEGLQMPGLLIYADDIKAAESLEEREDGPWGKFSGPFGRLEEESLFDEDGDSVLACEILDCEEREHVLRMMRCIGRHLAQGDGMKIRGRDELAEQLRSLVKYTDDPEIVNFAQALVFHLEESGK